MTVTFAMYIYADNIDKLKIFSTWLNNISGYSYHRRGEPEPEHSIQSIRYVGVLRDDRNSSYYNIIEKRVGLTPLYVSGFTGSCDEMLKHGMCATPHPANGVWGSEENITMQEACRILGIYAICYSWDEDGSACESMMVAPDKVLSFEESTYRIESFNSKKWKTIEDACTALHGSVMVCTDDKIMVDGFDMNWDSQDVTSLLNHVIIEQ